MKHKHIPYGSVNSWEVPALLSKGFIKFFSGLQWFFTGMKQTHSSIVLDRVITYDEKYDTFDPTDEYYELDGTTTTRINTFNANNIYSYTYRINAPEDVLMYVIEALKDKHLGKPYGILQTLYFIFRWAMEKANIDVRRWWNPLGFIFLICSELVYRYLMGVANIMEWSDLIEFMQQWRPDTAHSGDIRIIINFMKVNGYASPNFDM